MDEDRYHEGPITDAVLHEWAYDDDFWLSEQDEDLLVATFDNQCLFQYAADPDCPKNRMVQDIINAKLRTAFLQPGPGATQVKEIVALCERSDNPAMQQWGVRLMRSINVRRTGEKVDRERALEMGTLLLSGFGTDPRDPVSISGETHDEWIVERTHYGGADRLVIDKNESYFFRYERRVLGEYPKHPGFNL